MINWDDGIAIRLVVDRLANHYCDQRLAFIACAASCDSNLIDIYGCLVHPDIFRLALSHCHVKCT